MAIPELIKKLAHQVRTAIYGKDVREAIAKSMEVTGELSQNAYDTSQEQIKRVDRIIAQSGDDNTEIVDARGDHPLLSSRLNEADEEIKSINDYLYPPTYVFTASSYGTTLVTHNLNYDPSTDNLIVRDVTYAEDLKKDEDYTEGSDNRSITLKEAIDKGEQIRFTLRKGVK